MATATLTQTTTTAAVTKTQDTIPLASVTGLVAEGASDVPGSLLYVVDPGQKRGEAMRCISISGLSVGVRRVDFGVPHVSGATVYHGRPDRFYEYNPIGSVVAASTDVTPWINILTGEIWQPSTATLDWLPYAAPLSPTLTTVSAQAATATLVATDFDKILTNTGASGAIVLTLPTAAAAAGKSFKVQVTVAQTITLTPVSGEKIWLGGSGVASKYLLIAGVIGNYANLFSDGVSYYVTNYSGVLTKEA